MFGWALFYLLVVNAATFALFGADKRAARLGLWRTPEADLLRLAAAGGSPAVFVAIELFRHKTRKQPFRTWLWTIAALQCGALLVLSLPQTRATLTPLLAAAFSGAAVG